MKRQLRTPFFVVNPKAYLFGKDSVKLAQELDRLVEKHDIDVIYTCQQADIYQISQITRHLIISAQHMDGMIPGVGMGKILPDALKAAGADATFLNHAENRLTVENLVNAVKRADELGMLTIVCANSVAEAQMIATLHPDIMVCEPTELIGTGQVSDIDYMRATNEAVRSVDPNIYLLQAAGISTVEDVKQALASGADATGGTSGIIKANDPVKTVDEMLTVLVEWKKEHSA